jgi:hypothetical protein
MFRMTVSRGLVRAVSAAAVIAVLAGCSAVPASDTAATPHPASSSTPSAAQSPTPTPPPAETEPAVDLDDPGTWTIDFATLGPVQRGASVSDIGTSMDAFTATVNDGCPWITEYNRPSFPSIWLVASPASDIIVDVVLRAADADPGAADTGTAGPSPSTHEGIGVGSTLDQLTAAYPALQEIEGPPGEPSYAVTDSGGNWIDFAVSDGGVVHAIILRDKPGVPQEYCS